MIGPAARFNEALCACFRVCDQFSGRGIKLARINRDPGGQGELGRDVVTAARDGIARDEGATPAGVLP